MIRKIQNSNKPKNYHRRKILKYSLLVILVIGIGGIGVSFAVANNTQQNRNFLTESDNQEGGLFLGLFDSTNGSSNTHVDNESSDNQESESTDNNLKYEEKQTFGSDGHTHNWIAHYISNTIQTGTRYVVDVLGHEAVYENVCISPAGTYCNACGACVTGHQAMMEHTNATGHGGTHSQPAQYEIRVVSPAAAEQGHYEPIYSQEQTVDYYYCSECGERQ